MADYFMNLSLTDSGHAGTEIDPYSYTDYVNNLTVASYDHVYIKGDKTEGSVNFNSLLYHSGWNLSVNGPFKIQTTPEDYQFIAYGIEVRDCLSRVNAFLARSSSGNDATLKNSIIFATIPGGNPPNIDFNLVNNNAYVYGCLIVANDLYFYADTHRHILFQDCAFVVQGSDTGYYFDKVTADFSNCCSNVVITNNGGSDATINKINCQEDWIPPTFPGFNDPKESYGTSILFSGVNTPPEPGNPPYADYSTGLWGESRTGIGAGYFDTIAPEIIIQPQDATKFIGDSVSFLVDATGNPNIFNYVWRKDTTALVNGDRISGADTTEVTIMNLINGDAGNYSVIISNGILPDATSSDATLAFNSIVAPVITVQPFSQTKSMRDVAIFKVVASGDPTFYQWYFNGSILTNGHRISGSNTNILTISNLSKTEAGNYSVIVSNGIAPDATSNTVLLTVLSESFGNGQGSRQIALDSTFSVKFRRPFGQIFDRIG